MEFRPHRLAIVQKYGGSSLATTAQTRLVAARIARAHRAGDAVVVVVSARGDATDALLALAADVGGGSGGPECVVGCGREVDQLLATGECESAALLALALRGVGVPAVSLTGPQAGVRASGRPGAGVVTGVRTERILGLLAAGNVVVVAGFQGLNDDGDVITFGRGGSDTTAVAIAAALGLDECEIYTDVDGVCTADPGVVAEARVQPSVDVGVMIEMAFAGARVLHPRSIELAALQRLDVHVRRSASNTPGTVIRARGGAGQLEAANAVVGVTHDLDVARVLVQAPGPGCELTADVFNVMAHGSVAVDLVARSGAHETEFRMGFTVRRSDLAEIRDPLRQAVSGRRGTLTVDENVGKVSLVGTGLLSRPAYTARMMAALSGAGIVTSWIYTSQLRTSVATSREHALDAVRLLHREFGLERTEGASSV